MNTDTKIAKKTIQAGIEALKKLSSSLNRSLEFSKAVNLCNKANKIGITGWSLGGGVTLFSAWAPLKDAINSSVNFAAHLALYPPCIVVPEVLDFGESPIHILIGELDNWTPSDACVELVNQMGKKSNISLTDSDFVWGYESTTYGRGTAFVAMSETQPFVTPNPETGVMEHADAKWVSFEDMIENTVDFLKPAVIWAFRRIHGE